MEERKSWAEKFQEVRAYWRRDDEAGAETPHLELPFGLHSNGIFRFDLVRQRPALLSEVCRYLLWEKLQLYMTEPGTCPEWFVGVDLDSCTMAHELARHLGKKTALVYSPRLMDSERTVLVQYDFNLDTVTTIEQLGSQGRNIDDHLIVLHNSTGQDFAHGRKIVAVIDRPIQTWQSSKCPLCEQGSKALYPYNDEGWVELTRPQTPLVAK